MKAKQLIKVLDDYQATSFADFEVKGISCNSKGVSPGFIFIAIKGTHEDGEKFIPEAIRNGAQLIIASNYKGSCFIAVKETRYALATLSSAFYGNPSRKIKVVGITGTNGKTTISYLIEKILANCGLSSGVIGTVNYRFKDKIIPSQNTTPCPTDLQAIFAQMLKERIKYAVIEVSSHALDQARIGGIDFNSAIFTNLTQDHLDYHLTIENYFLAKVKLFNDLSRDAFCVLNNDDPYGRKLAALTKSKVVTYGIENNSSLMARDIKLDISGSEFTLLTDDKKIKMKVKLIGKYNIYNILAALAWALRQGLDLAKAKSAIEDFELVPGRLERILCRGGFTVFVDYAHTEDALKNVITSLRPLTKGRLIVVFGCGGDRDKNKRSKMGKVVSELSDFAVITNDNPRSEDPQAIIEDIKSGIIKDNYAVLPDRTAAIKKALTIAKAQDTVLIAGKGHENCQILKDKTVPFNDCEAVRKCLQSMNY